MFSDRRDAGRRIADALFRFKDRDPVVLALVRGGVPVGFEVARALDAPLDIVLVRKVGAPDRPEFAAGAIVDGTDPEIVINTEVMHLTGMTEEDFSEVAKPQLAEIERRRLLYLGGRRRPELAGKTAIITDDGVATGATTRAALRAIRRQKPARLVLAVPVAPPETIAELRVDADEIVCLETPTTLVAISRFYDRFEQVGDDEVIDLLDRAQHVRER